RVVDAAAGTVAKFCVVSVTVMADPGSAVKGAESAGTCRSGPTASDVVLVLLVSTDSGTVCPPSATTIRYRVPGVASAGIVTSVEPALSLPLPRTPTGKLPINVSPESRMLSRVNDALPFYAAAGTVAKFCVVSVTVMVNPGAAPKGAESADTCRSGRA